MQPIISSLSLDQMRTAMNRDTTNGETTATRLPTKRPDRSARDWGVLAFSGLVGFLPNSWPRGRRA
jgi:hypothetical protein